MAPGHPARDAGGGRPLTGALYLDASATVKLLLEEPDKPSLEAFLAREPHRVSSLFVSSLLMKTEVLRAVRRYSSARIAEADLQRVFADITFLSIGESLIETAGRLDPPALRSLDAIHLASAMLLGDELDALVTYDRRLAQAARALGIRVFPEPSEN